MDFKPSVLSYNKNTGDVHSLLEPSSLAYSSVTVRRAFLVWMYCGQANKFKDVCNYFHYLEVLEDTLPEESRAVSRQHEFSLFSGRPPVSAYLVNNFPTLYPAVTQHVTRRIAQIETKHDIFKARGVNNTARVTGTSKAEIFEASMMIRDYCKRNMKSLKGFLKEFKEHTERCGLTNTVGNIALYIKRKIIQSEIQLEANYAITLELLTRHCKDEDVDDVPTGSESQSETDQSNSLILKKAHSLHTNPVKPKENSREDIKNLQDIYDKNENDERNNFNSVSYGFIETLHRDGVESKVRNRKFSDSDLIIRDLLKSSKIL